MMTNEQMFELKSIVRRTLEEQMEMYNERWVRAEDLQSHFAMLTPSWVRRYGHALPRRLPQVTDESGEVHGRTYLYPVHQIQRMFANGDIEKLTCRAVVV